MDEDTTDVVEAVRRCSELADALARLVLGDPEPAPPPRRRR
ncbi:hypothetical protein [Actinokineospora sp. PR83]|nr:hypothetical protein [Actinokineospora sp. PR83]